MYYETFGDTGRQKREQGGINEDSLGVTVIDRFHRDRTQSTGIFVVADGAGGHNSGDTASYLATTVVLERLRELLGADLHDDPTAFGLDRIAPDQPSTADNRILDAIDQAINDAHAEILRYANETNSSGMLTTVTVGVKRGNQLYYGWVGDSPAYLINRATEIIEPLVREHALVAERRRSGELDAIEALVHPEGNKITRAVGGSAQDDPNTASVTVDTRTIDLYGDDILVFTSDGLVDAGNLPQRTRSLYQKYQSADDPDQVAKQIRAELVTENDIKQIVLDAGNLKEIADQFVAFANQKGGKDNISGIVCMDPTLQDTPTSPPERGVGPAEQLPQPADSHGPPVPSEASDTGGVVAGVVQYLRRLFSWR